MSSNQKGFTIIELMIATSVFTVVLLVCTYGVLQIGRMYYKGAVTSRTQETARGILDEVTEAIKFNGGIVYANEAGGVHCIGSKRFSFARDTILTASNSVLLTDFPASSCSTGIAPQPLNSPGAGSRELMNTRMRLVNFSITPVAGTTDTYRVTVKVISGENDVLTASHDSCVSARAGSQYCAVSELSTTVRRRL